MRNADVAYLLTHPVPVIDAGIGACADGICLAATTVERVAYTGGGDPADRRPVADYTGKNWDPESCGGPSDEAADCGGQDITYWHNQDGVRTTEPGVQVYEDPDPQASPLGPYPLPAAYVGTCGVILGGGDTPTRPTPRHQRRAPTSGRHRVLMRRIGATIAGIARDGRAAARRDRVQRVGRRAPRLRLADVRPRRGADLRAARRVHVPEPDEYAEAATDLVRADGGLGDRLSCGRRTAWPTSARGTA